MDPSLAVVDTSALGPAAMGHVFDGALLVSSGDGSLTLLHRGGSSAAAQPALAPALPSVASCQPRTASPAGMYQTALVCPLVPPAPLAGRRPFVIEAAYALPNGAAYLHSALIKQALSITRPPSINPATS